MQLIIIKRILRIAVAVRNTHTSFVGNKFVQCVRRSRPNNYLNITLCNNTNLKIKTGDTSMTPVCGEEWWT